ncbi:MAG TPA: hypothetical protein VIO61_14110 [Anaerolineaceae bacterium]
MVDTFRSEPFQEIPVWELELQQIAAQPLEYCPDFPSIAKRYDAWWEGEILDRPIFQFNANTNPARPITRRLEYLFEPDRWYEEKMLDLKQVKLVGDALPAVRPDFGPVVLGVLFGGKGEFYEDTTWVHPMINDDWSSAPDWSLNPNHPWWIQLLKLANLVAEQGKGRYLFFMPNLGGSADILLNLRGSQQLCLDVIDQPEKIVAAINAIYPAWREALHCLLTIAMQHKVGFTYHPVVWSSKVNSVFECDFNYLIGKRDFERLLLPDLARQAGTVSRAMFHLDGPGAAKHIDALLAVPQIQAIQYVPGAGNSALEWIPMYKKIQAARKALQIICTPGEVLRLCEELKPEGLALSGSAGVEEIDALYEQFCKRYR